jgi:hypothetical protein
MVHHEFWRTDRAGVLSAESSDFRLLVQPPEEVGGAVRFLVLRRGSGGLSDTLAGSGTKESVRAAMGAAERMAERCEGFDH